MQSGSQENNQTWTARLRDSPTAHLQVETGNRGEL